MKNILDLPETTIESSKIIHQKKFFKKLYQDFYLILKLNSEKLPNGKSIELGSGGGFIKEVLPSVITSDVIKLPMCDKVIDAEKIPFPDNSLSAIYMLNTFHHIKNPKRAIKEFHRTLKNGGRVIMIEPYNSWWGRLIYKNFHYEGFDEKALDWKIKGTGPLSDANNALPWIVFERDRKKYQKLFPHLSLKVFLPHTPVRYLFSGGLKKHQLSPTFLYPAIKFIENLIKPFHKQLGMFVTIVLEKN